MTKSSLNALSKLSSDSIEALESVHKNLIEKMIMKTGTKNDLKEIKFLKNELATCINTIIDQAAHDPHFPKDVKIDHYGSLHTMKLSSHTNLALVMHAYTALKREYIDKIPSKEGTLHTTKKSLTDALIDEDDEGAFDDELDLEDLKNESGDMNMNTKPDADASFRDEVGKCLGIEDITADNCYDLLDDIDRDDYEEQDLTELSYLLNKNYRTTRISTYVRKFVSFLKGKIKEHQGSHSSKLTKEEQMKMNEDAHNIFVSGIRHFDDFVTSINDMNPQQSSFSRYPNFDVLKKDLSSYAAFLQFRKDFIGKYSSTVYESYETLFKEQKYLDKFFYESLLIKMKSLGEMYAKMPDQQFFFGMKKGFLLGDIYDFIIKNVGEEVMKNVVFSPFLSKELKRYTS